MKLFDLLRMGFGSVVAHSLRCGLSALGIGVGIAAVILLTSIGEGINRYVIDEFSQFGTNIISIQPGKSKPSGASIAMFASDRPLTLTGSGGLPRIPSVLYSVSCVHGSGCRQHRRTVASRNHVWH